MTADIAVKSSRFCLLLQSPLRRRCCYFLARQKVTKERPEGAEKLKSLDFSPLWTPPATHVYWGKERLFLPGLAAFFSLAFIRLLLSCLRFSGKVRYLR